MLIAACLIIIAWTATMPLWASISITVMSGLAIVCNLLAVILRMMQLSE